MILHHSMYDLVRNDIHMVVIVYVHIMLYHINLSRTSRKLTQAP